MVMIAYEEFQKLELKIGTVIEAEKIPETDKLLKLKVDFGSETRQIVSGIAEVIPAEEIVGKQYPFILNLEPRVIRGIESQGMILAASDGEKPVLISPLNTVPPGSTVK
jgi:methionine--tRNA ligase beta chain